MDDNKEPRKLTEEEKEILGKIEKAQSEEELMTLIDELKQKSPDAQISLTPVPMKSKKYYYTMFILDYLLLIFLNFALISIFKPFTVVFEHGIYIYISSVVISNFIIRQLLRFIKHPYVFLFKGIISSILLLIAMCTIPLFMKETLVTNYNSLFFISIFTLALKMLILPTLSKFIKG